MAITPLPPAPSRAVPSTFSTLADAFLGALSTFVTEANALETNVNAKEAAAALSATGAAASAVVSASSETVALAAANYKGEWTALSGAATIPYSVSLSGRFWMLNTNVANVTTEMPGVSTKWTEIYPVLRSTINTIGTPGAMGFGVGICPPENLPVGMVGLPGYDQLGHDNYGNYQFTEGSVMIWVPRFYYRIAHASNPTYATYGVNSIDIKGIDTYPTTVLANAAGYALHRAFIDGGVEKLGFFRDKYKCSKVANGSGYTAASIKNGLPLSSAAAHNPFSGLTGGANYHYSAIDLAHRRDGVDGAVNPSSIFFCSSQFLRSAIAMLSMAHGQAATSTANCAWYHATYNYPKGCNNNALSDADDTTVKWESDGFETGSGVYNCGKTGSAGYGGGAGNVFAKSTHNGQNCGSADDNGLMNEISIGLTCIASTKAIEAISQANPCEITITGHGLVDGDVMNIGTAITQADWVGLKDKVWPITKTGNNTFTVAFDSSGFGTAYDAVADPGTCVLGTFYAAKEATSMKDFTNGVAAETDHWGATGVADMMERFAPPFGDGDAFTQRFGSGANQVLSEATSGAGYVLSGLGMPKDGDGMNATGTNLFGKDYCYVYVTNGLCLHVAYYWSSPTGAESGLRVSEMFAVAPAALWAFARQHIMFNVDLRFEGEKIMTKIYKYQKVTDEYTTYCLVEPDYNLLETEDRITELCTIDGITYVSVPDSITLPEQPEQITVEEVVLTEELKESIKSASPHVQLINERVVAKIRERYSLNDEIKLLRIGLSEESTVYNDYVEECRDWGRVAKVRLGL